MVFGSTVKEYCDSPSVFTIDNFLNNEQCDHMIKISKDSMKNSLVSSDNKGVVSSGRNSENTWIKHDYDKTTYTIAQMISQLVQIPLENAESFQVIHYNENSEYRNHYDSWIHNYSEKTLRCMKYGGARIKTALVYLNEVESGGSTHMTKLNIEIKPLKGRLLIFENTYKGTNERHPLSEHAGMPVLKGEKYAFNLWFRECSFKRLYSDFNPNYYSNIQLKNDEVDTRREVTGINFFSKNITHDESFFSENDCLRIISDCDFSKSKNKYKNCWLQKVNYTEFVKRIEDYTKISSEFYENFNIVKYCEDEKHGPFFDAYNLNSESGKKNTEKLGQRLYTVSIVLSNIMELTFPELNETNKYKQGTLIFYDNMKNNIRNEEMIHTIYSSMENTYLLNIYIREKTPLGKLMNKQNSSDPCENYYQTYEEVLKMMNENIIAQDFKGHKSFVYMLKGNFEYFKTAIQCVFSIPRKNNSVLNEENLKKEYIFDEFNPVIVEDVLLPNSLYFLQSYYKETISSGVFPLGDRQSNRYKAHNEPVSRFLHYEILPLVEKITNKKLSPTYTYLSAYVNGANLPAHTDRPDCQFTVSFIVNKDNNKPWPIYLDKTKQEIKHKGRYDFTPDKCNCFELDCKEGGLMIFSGTDHIHFREELKHSFYHVLLLHYKIE